MFDFVSGERKSVDVVLGKGDILEGVFSSRKWGGVTLLGSGVDVHTCVYAGGYCASCECVSMRAFVCL